MISVAPLAKGGFELRSDGEPCGSRLVKSQPFPLPGARWWEFSDASEAQRAAERLQKYLGTHARK